MLARYTPAEARALESHYIACAQREGIWGMGRMPLSASDKTRSVEAGTAAGMARQEQAHQRRMEALKAVRKGAKVASEVATVLGVTNNCARRYMRILHQQGWIEPMNDPHNGEMILWRAVDASLRAA